jgi:hypothetical protein
MFYEQIPINEIAPDVQECYEKKVKPYIGQLVLDGHEVVKLLGLIRDDDFDGEWCYRFLVFPSEYYWRRADWREDHLRECIDPSILCTTVIPLKGRITDDEYDRLEDQWKMNEEGCPYSKDWTKY